MRAFLVSTLAMVIAIFAGSSASRLTGHAVGTRALAQYPADSGYQPSPPSPPPMPTYDSGTPPYRWPDAGGGGPSPADASIRPFGGDGGIQY